MVACAELLCADGDCTNEAASATNAINLAKSLASRQQMGEAGEIIAGVGSGKIFRDASLIVQEYGGQAIDWVKKTSSAFVSPDGTIIQTHWVENLETGLQVQFKTKLF